MTATNANLTAITGTDITAFMTSDAQRSIAFYRDVLGLVPTDVDAQGRGAEFALPDGSTFGVWKPDEGPQSGAMIMFAVPDIGAAVALFRLRGAELTEPEETPLLHVVRRRPGWQRVRHPSAQGRTLGGPARVG